MHTSTFLVKESIARRASRHKFSHSIPFILAVIFMLTAMSCGGGTTNNTGSPIANPGGPYLGNANQSLAFNGSGSSAPSGRTLTSFAWLFGDGASGAGATTAHTYTIAGNYTATLTVTDSSGATNSSTVAVQIITAPVAKPGGPYSGKVGVAVSFNGSASTAPPGQALGFTWNFGDGVNASGATPSHTYASAGTFTVSLTVTDDTAGVSTATTTATITAGPGPSGQAATPSTFFAIGPAADASTQFAYVLSTPQTGASSLSIEVIDTATGELRPANVTAPPLDSKFVPAGMITDPFRKFLYLYGGNSVQTFSISSDTGALTASGIIATGGSLDRTNKQMLLFNPSGKFAFFITQDPTASDPTAPGSVTRFSVDPATGTLGAIETISAQVSRPQASVIDASGKFLYISGAAPASPTAATFQITVFSIDAGSGAVTPTPGSPFSIQSGGAPSAMAVDPAAQFLYAAGASSATGAPTLSVFAINSGTGILSETFSPLALDSPGSYVSSIALSPSGNFDYVLTSQTLDNNSDHYSIRLLKRDSQTGAPKSADVISTWSLGPANPARIPNGNLTIFSPDQVGASDATSKAGRSAILILTTSTDATINVQLNDPKTGLLVLSTTWNALFH